MVMSQPVSQSGYLSGKLLIASPLIGDPRFDRAVVFVCSHDDDQAMGLIMNRPMDGLHLPELLDQLEIAQAERAPDEPVLDGGPVDRDRGFVLHTTDAGCGPGSLVIADRVALTATREILDCLVCDARPKRAMMALGYAGWDAGQLEDEIAANAWLVCEPDEALLFALGGEEKWARALGLLGVTPEFLTAASGHA
ncbi:MAG: YqgE/AlgH family protein [Oceanicaulis sp.]